MSVAQSGEQKRCCCHPYNPIENTVYRCIARAMDLGHCRAGDCACRPPAPDETTPTEGNTR